ncbi:hypothetical protein FRC12_003307 [Ceratobasidium sp. 428]|nr:hypothetical protein FRC12_003307 [Ceratobasidium sp. 428]
MDVFTQWKNAQLQLEKAAQAFFDASIKLRAAVSQHFIVPNRDSAFEDLISKIQSQMTLNNSIETQLTASRAVINSTRNMSPVFVPISILPPELFSRIFTFAIASTYQPLGYYGRDPLLAISVVSTRWRQLATGTRSLWSHINLLTPSSTISSSDRIAAARLWLERSQGTPLHLYIDLSYPMVNQHYLSQLFCELRPHITYLSSLVFPGTVKETVGPFLKFLSDHGVSGSLKSLMIDSNRFGEDQARQSWPTTYLRGLVDLQLSNLPRSISPTFQELYTTLSGSPTLSTLRLRDMDIPPGQAPAISLPELRLLDITGLNRLSLFGLLNMLSLGGLELDFRFSLKGLTDRDTTDVILPFCRRSNIASLYLFNTNEGLDGRVISLLSHIPFVRVLVLDNDHDDFHVGNIIDTNSNEKSARCPKLQTLCIITRTGINEYAQTHLENLLDFYSLNAIVLEGVGLEPCDSELRYSDDEEAWIEQRNRGFLDRLTKKVHSIVVNENVLGGDDETVDLYIRKLIVESQRLEKPRNQIYRLRAKLGC